ncbi:MAG: DUF4233 domain-containing protein [Jatrophihabitans sp.]|nr:MAG: DUF4233 domain-containing protein [Jatrophihabitans sp.]
MSTPTNTPAGPTAEQVAARSARANRATRSALAGILVLEALVTALVPRGIAYTAAGLGATRTVVLLVLAGLMVLTAGLLRRPFGIGVGSVLQVAFIATGVFLGAMFVIGVIFAGLWCYLLRLRHELVGTPSGLRVFIS